MKKLKSVYQRMYDDKGLFFLGYGVLYITEMKRVKNLLDVPELRIKSKYLAENWHNLCGQYGLLPKSDKIGKFKIIIVVRGQFNILVM